MKFEELRSGMKVVPFMKSGSRFLNLEKSEYKSYIRRSRDPLMKFFRKNGYLVVKAKEQARRIAYLCDGNDLSHWNNYRPSDFVELEKIEDGQYCLLF